MPNTASGPTYARTPARHGVSKAIDRLSKQTASLGIDRLIYDYAPRSLAIGAVPIPTLIEGRGVPETMAVEWCEMGFYGVDPVQRRANQTTRPFVWSYYKDEPTVIAQNLEETAVAAIAQRLMSWGLGRGVTVPIHLPGNRFATMTGFLESPNLSEEDVARFSYLVACAQDAMTPHLRPFNVIGPIRPLTDRETECVRLTGEGLSSKQIAVALQRTERTVVMHLQSAARKLGARNRVHTVVKAGEYGLLH